MAVKNKFQDVRDVLMAQLEDLDNPDKPVDMNRIKAINMISTTLVESVKAEALIIKSLTKAFDNGIYRIGTDYIPLPEKEVIES